MTLADSLSLYPSSYNSFNSGFPILIPCPPLTTLSTVFISRLAKFVRWCTWRLSRQVIATIPFTFCSALISPGCKCNPSPLSALLFPTGRNCFGKLRREGRIVHKIPSPRLSSSSASCTLPIKRFEHQSISRTFKRIEKIRKIYQRLHYRPILSVDSEKCVRKSQVVSVQLSKANFVRYSEG